MNPGDPLSRGEKLRALLFACLTLVLLSGLVARLYSLQVRQHDKYLSQARKQHRRKTDLKPWRGDIFFREQNRNVLVAGSVGRHSLMIHGRQRDPEALQKALSRILNLDGHERADLRRRLGRGRSFWFHRRKVSHTQAAALKKGLKKLVKVSGGKGKKARYRAELTGFDVIEEPVRIYPFGSLACHVLGLVNVDGKGLSGIELSFNEQLKGLSGLEEFEIDNRRRQLADVTTVSVPALPGYSLALTIDRRIQFFT